MSETKKKHRYKHAEGKRWVEIRIKNPLQLFDARDPALFRERVPKVIINVFALYLVTEFLLWFSHFLTPKCSKYRAAWVSQLL